MKILWNPWVDKAESGKRKAEKISQTGRGFSLIELLGVLAVMGILAAVTVPPIIRQIQQARTTNEEANLEEVARSIVEGIKAGGIIPNPNITSTIAGGWVAIASPSSTLSASSLQYVFPLDPASALTERRVYLDPALMTYLDSYFGVVTGLFNTPAGGWPTVTAGGVPFPNQAIKLYIVSSSRPDFVLACSPNGAGIQVAGNNYGNPAGAPLIDQLSSWIKAVDPVTRFIVAPGTAVENWPNNGHQFLHVKVVDLRPLFCKVTLIDTACPPTATITTIGDYTYANPNVSFFGGVAVFDIFDTALSPITPSRVLAGTDRVILRTPYPQFLGRASALDAANPLGGTALLTPAQVTPALNPQPRFLIPISGSATPPPAGLFPANVQTFYVLKGTALQLWDNASASSVLTTTIESDCSFKYFGNTWTKVD